MKRMRYGAGAPLFAALVLLVGCQDIDPPAAPPPDAHGNMAAVSGPTEAELAVYRAALLPSLQRRPVSSQRRASGVTVVDLGESFDSVSLAAIREDGSAQVGCVESLAEADAFLRSSPGLDR
jgi:hypothetical protein